MKKRNKKLLLATTILATMSAATTPVFAANPYGIEYEGGVLLGEEVVNVLDKPISPLIEMDENLVVEFSDSDLWKDGYSFDVARNCKKVKYIKIPENVSFENLNNVYYTISNQKYKIKVNITNIINQMVYNDEENDNEWTSLAVMIDDETSTQLTPKGQFETGFKISNDSECSAEEENNIMFYTLTRDHGRIFVEMEQTLLRIDGEQEKPLTTDDLYYGIMDIDALQSFKVLNTSNQLTGGSNGNMFAKSLEALQSTDDEDGKNMYVGEDGKYIYSSIPNFTIDAGNDIYVKLNEATQNEGLKIVYGFASGASSPISYYAEQYNIDYISDKNGEVDGIKTERVIAGEAPSGSSTTPEDGYEFDYWIADRDVNLKDDIVVKAGNPISAEELAEIIVDKDIVFTAIHVESEPIKIPDTGASTSEKNAALIVFSIVGVVLGASILGVLAKTIRKIRRRSQF